LDGIPRASVARRSVAHAIDLLIVAVVFAVFLTPVVAVYSGQGPSTTLLKIAAWVYVAIFVLLALAWFAGKRRRQTYVTAGMSTMDLYPLRIDGVTTLVSGEHVPEMGDSKRGRAAAVLVLPLILVGAVFVAFEIAVFA